MFHLVKKYMDGTVHTSRSTIEGAKLIVEEFFQEPHAETIQISRISRKK